MTTINGCTIIRTVQSLQESKPHVGEALPVEEHLNTIYSNIGVLPRTAQKCELLPSTGTHLLEQLSCYKGLYQCCRYSRNIAWVTPKIIYFSYQEICFCRIRISEILFF